MSVTSAEPRSGLKSRLAGKICIRIRGGDLFLEFTCSPQSEPARRHDPAKEDVGAKGKVAPSRCLHPSASIYLSA